LAAPRLGTQGQIAFQDYELGGGDLPCPEFQATLDTAALIETPSPLKGATTKYKMLIAKLQPRESDAA